MQLSKLATKNQWLEKIKAFDPKQKREKNLLLEPQKTVRYMEHTKHLPQVAEFS